MKLDRPPQLHYHELGIEDFFTNCFRALQVDILWAQGPDDVNFEGPQINLRGSIE